MSRWFIAASISFLLAFPGKAAIGETNIAVLFTGNTMGRLVASPG